MTQARWIFIVSAIIPPAVLLPIKMWKWMEQEI